MQEVVEPPPGLQTSYMGVNVEPVQRFKAMAAKIGMFIDRTVSHHKGGCLTL